MATPASFHVATPIQPDLDKLLQAFGKPEEGRVIRHEEIEAALGMRRGTSRYRAVLGKWRRKLVELHNVQLGLLVNVGYKALLPDERIDDSLGQFKRGARRIKEGVKRAASTHPDDLDPLHRARREHLIVSGGHIARQLTNLRRELPKLPTPPAGPEHVQLPLAESTAATAGQS